MLAPDSRINVPVVRSFCAPIMLRESRAMCILGFRFDKAKALCRYGVSG
jgi:hypothetical protein